jgi:hypothetical protein
MTLPHGTAVARGIECQIFTLRDLGVSKKKVNVQRKSDIMFTLK